MIRTIIWYNKYHTHSLTHLHHVFVIILLTKLIIIKTTTTTTTTTTRKMFTQIIAQLCQQFPMFQKREFRVLLIGLDRAGKTNVLERMKEIFSEGSIKPIPEGQIKQTVGLNVAKLEQFDCKWTFWDLGGLERLRPIWLKYYRDSHGVLFIVDSVDEQRIDEAKAIFKKIVLENEDLRDAPILIVANKIDESGPEGMQMVKTAFESIPCSNRRYELETNSNSYNKRHVVIGASAFTGQGLKEAVEWMCLEISGSERQRELDFV